MITIEGFVVLKDSGINSNVNKSCPKVTIRKREDYRNRIVDNVITEKLLFGSNSSAVSFVGGTSLNCNEYWKHF